MERYTKVASESGLACLYSLVLGRRPQDPISTHAVSQLDSLWSHFDLSLRLSIGLLGQVFM